MSDENVRFRSSGKVKEDQTLLEKEGKISSNSIEVYKEWYFALISLFVILIISIVYSAGEYLPASKQIDSISTDFSGERARLHLNAITSLGPRPAGSYANDILAVEYLTRELDLIKDNADPGFIIEIEVQKVSGSFAFYRDKTRFSDPVGTTVTYDNTTNVIVKLSPRESTKHFVLANAHFDTVPNTEGASDDTVNCAILMEIYRALTKSKPSELQHGVIFLFNGAEEGGLSGAHGFLQHRWFPLVEILINLEAAGSGGQEFVFQTGPGHPWILDMYASTAKYPFTTVLAQEVFHANIIPSDTDYRVFSNYGNVVGVDIAFVKNGYVYHTKYDEAKAIPSGSIQRAGDNVLNLIQGIITSSYLENPGKYKHGSSIFYDVLGLFMVRYPKRLHILMNWITCGIITLYLLKKLVTNQRLSSKREHGNAVLLSTDVSYNSLFFCVLTVIISWITGFVVPVCAAIILTKLDALMMWYSYPKFTLLLYGMPALFGMMLGHLIGNNIISKFSKVNIRSFVCGHLMIHVGFLFYLNMHDISSSFILWIWIIFPFGSLCILQDVINIVPEKRPQLTFMLHLLGTFFPMLISVYHLDHLFNFFGPLFGRMGDKLPSDIVMAILTAFSFVFTLSYLMNLFHFTKNKLKILLTVGLVALLPLAYVLSGRIKPYSGSNPITPKRLYMVHVQRTFHDANGLTRKKDSGIWIQPVDALAFRPLKNIAHFKNAEDFQCDGSYCGLPYYHFKRAMLKKQWYLRGESPEGISKFPLTISIYSRVSQDDGSVKFYFDIAGPDHMVLFLTLENGTKLDWSMYMRSDGHIYGIKDYNGGFTHIVFYTKGYGDSSWKFWIQFKRTVPGAFAELGIARHYVHGKYSRTRFLNATMDALPSWVYSNSYCSNYDSFTLA